MISANIYDINGKVAGKINLPAEFFGAKINQPLLAQAVRVYLANQRKAQAKTKTRGEVAKTSAKWFRQKGTGHARHGARSAPIFVGGGVAHGPGGTQNWKMLLPKKMRKQALASALTNKFKNKEVMVVGGWEKITRKTKEVVSVLNSFLDKSKKTPKFLLVLPKKNDQLVRASRNIPGIQIKQINLLNPWEVLNGGKILMTPEAIETLKKL